MGRAAFLRWKMEGPVGSVGLLNLRPECGIEEEKGDGRDRLCSTESEWQIAVDFAKEASE